ncbi:DUF1176 domain-containing protein [Pseudoduganella lutea]|uniref:DUF1176 domain-containing protein n=1 Tax=Pseudoduganella lutea TaxID=321985 RepID=A0A4P6KZ53_9BURK|nr:DUF1176 domain-containing protein [Pseudoduganella lutea]QBE64386.1 DUF1176 domain-containing protein [Pseudoduganella lutea]
MKILVTALLGACALAAFAGAPAGFHFAHHDWEIACDNTRTCRAAGYHHRGEDDDTPEVSVVLERAAGPGQPVKATLRLGIRDEKEWVPKTGVTMHVDGRALGHVAIGSEYLTGELSPAQIQALVATVAGTGAVQWRDGARAWALSGAGAAAVLLKMDEFQGRLGTPGALLRKGARAENSVPAAPPMPEVLAAPAGNAEVNLPPAARAALLRELRGTLGEGDCEALVPDDLSIRRLTTARLLVYGQCWAGAAGTGTAYWVANNTAPFKPVLVTTDGSDHEAGKISAGHGMGSCRETREWVWDGNRFVPTLVSDTGICQPVGLDGTWDLPTHVAKVMRRPR